MKNASRKTLVTVLFLVLTSTFVTSAVVLPSAGQNETSAPRMAADAQSPAVQIMGEDVGSNFRLYNAPETFVTDIDGQDPAGWTVCEDGGPVTVENSVDGHSKVVHLNQQLSSWAACGIRKPGAQNVASGSFEFWYKATGAETHIWFKQNSGGFGGIHFYLTTWGLLYYTADTIYVMRGGNYLDGVWHRYSISFSTSNHQFQVYRDGSSMGTGVMYGTPAALNYLFIDVVGPGDQGYVDAIGFSWDGSYTAGENAEVFTHDGQYYGSDTFFGDAVGSHPQGWTVCEDYGHAHVKAWADGHSKVVHLNQQSGSWGPCGIRKPGAQNVQQGAIEFWYKGTGAETHVWFTENPNSFGGMHFYITTWGLLYYTGGSATVIVGGNFLDNQWHHYRLWFDVASRRFDVFCDGTFRGSGIMYGTPTALNYFLCDVVGPHDQGYVDAVGFSWDPNYHLDANRNPIHLSYLYEYKATDTFNSGSLTPWTDNFGRGDVVVAENMKSFQHAVRVSDTSTSTYTSANREFGTAVATGTVELWVYPLTTTGDIFVSLADAEWDAGPCVHFSSAGKIVTYAQGGMPTERMAYSPRPYHVRVDFNSNARTYAVAVDGAWVATGVTYLNSGCGNIVRMWVSTGGTSLTQAYFAYPGYSWVSGYVVGDNVKVQSAVPLFSLSYASNLGTYPASDTFSNGLLAPWTDNFGRGDVVVAANVIPFQHAVRVSGTSTSTYTSANREFGTAVAEGTVELWVYPLTTTGDIYVSLADAEWDAGPCVHFKSNGAIATYTTGGMATERMTYMSRPYYIQIHFNSPMGTFAVAVDGIWISSEPYLSSSCGSITRMWVSTGDTSTSQAYFAYPGYSWDSSYTLGSNMAANPGNTPPLAQWTIYDATVGSMPTYTLILDGEAMEGWTNMAWTSGDTISLSLLDLLSISKGNHVLDLTVADGTGRVTTKRIILLVNTIPTAVGPADFSYLSFVETKTITWVVSDPDIGPGAFIEVRRDGAFLQSWAFTTNGQQVTVPCQKDTLGVHAYSLYADDGYAGLILLDTVQVTAAEAEWQYDPDLDGFTSPANVRLSGSDAEDNIRLSSQMWVAYNDDGMSNQLGQVTGNPECRAFVQVSLNPDSDGGENAYYSIKSLEIKVRVRSGENQISGINIVPWAGSTGTTDRKATHNGIVSPPDPVMYALAKESMKALAAAADNAYGTFGLFGVATDVAFTAATANYNTDRFPARDGELYPNTATWKFEFIYEDGLQTDLGLWFNFQPIGCEDDQPIIIEITYNVIVEKMIVDSWISWKPGFEKLYLDADTYSLEKCASILPGAEFHPSVDTVYEFTIEAIPPSQAHPVPGGRDFQVFNTGNIIQRYTFSSNVQGASFNFDTLLLRPGEHSLVHWVPALDYAGYIVPVVTINTMVDGIVQGTKTVMLAAVNDIAEDLGTWQTYTPGRNDQIKNAGAGQVDIGAFGYLDQDWWVKGNLAPRVVRTIPGEFSMRFQIPNLKSLCYDRQAGIFLSLDDDNVVFWGFWENENAREIRFEAVVNNQGYWDENGVSKGRYYWSDFSWLGIRHFGTTWEFWYFTQNTWVKAATMTAGGAYIPSQSLGFTPTTMGLFVKDWYIFSDYPYVQFRNVRLGSA